MSLDATLYLGQLICLLLVVMQHTTLPLHNFASCLFRSSPLAARSSSRSCMKHICMLDHTPACAPVMYCWNNVCSQDIITSVFAHAQGCGRNTTEMHTRECPAGQVSDCTWHDSLAHHIMTGTPASLQTHPSLTVHVTAFSKHAGKSRMLLNVKHKHVCRCKNM